MQNMPIRMCASRRLGQKMESPQGHHSLKNPSLRKSGVSHRTSSSFTWRMRHQRCSSCQAAATKTPRRRRRSSASQWPASASHPVGSQHRASFTLRCRPARAVAISCFSASTNPVFPGPPLAPPTQYVIHRPISQCASKRQASAMGSCAVSRWAHQSRTRPRGPPWRTRRGRTTPRCFCTPAAPPAAQRACHSATVSLEMNRYCNTVLCNVV